MYICTHIGYVCTCAYVCVCVFRGQGGKSCSGHRGNRFPSKPGLTFTGKVSQLTCSPLNLPEAYFCVCAKGRASIITATVI